MSLEQCWYGSIDISDATAMQEHQEQHQTLDYSIVRVRLVISALLQQEPVSLVMRLVLPVFH